MSESDEILQTFGWLVGAQIVRIWTEVREGEGPLRGVWTFMALKKAERTAVLMLESSDCQPGYLSIQELDGGKARLCQVCKTIYSLTQGHTCEES